MMTLMPSLNFGQVLLVGALNGNNKLDPPLLGDGIARRWRIFRRIQEAPPSLWAPDKVDQNRRPQCLHLCTRQHIALLPLQLQSRQQLPCLPCNCRAGRNSLASPAIARETIATAYSSSPAEPCLLAMAYATSVSLAALVCCSLNSANTLSKCWCGTPFSKSCSRLLRHLVVHLP